MNTQYVNINFIRHLNAFYTLVHEHERLWANDISLCTALFWLWNLEHFAVSSMVDRSSVVPLNRIGSLCTCLQYQKQLYDFGFLSYEPSGRIFLRRVIEVVPLDKNELQKHKKYVAHMCSNKDPVASKLRSIFI